MSSIRFKRKMSEEEIDAITEVNPKLVEIRVPSKHSKAGYFEIAIHEALIEFGVDISVQILKNMLVDETKTGKIGTFQIKQTGTWKNLKLPKYTTIHLYVEQTKN